MKLYQIMQEKRDQLADRLNNGETIPSKTPGICVMVTNAIMDCPSLDYHERKSLSLYWRTTRTRWYESWPLYSGSETFPVPAESGYEQPVLGFGTSKVDLALSRFNFVDLWIGEYGYLRFQLFDHLIRCAKAESI